LAGYFVARDLRKALRFAYMDVAIRRSDKGREQDAVSFCDLWCSQPRFEVLRRGFSLTPKIHQARQLTI
jgi:hypothetical protein